MKSHCCTSTLLLAMMVRNAEVGSQSNIGDGNNEDEDEDKEGGNVKGTNGEIDKVPATRNELFMAGILRIIGCIPFNFFLFIII